MMRRHLRPSRWWSRCICCKALISQLDKEPGFKSVEEIEAAVASGKVVHWATEAYQVKQWPDGKFVIVCPQTNYAIGLSYGPNKTPNGKLEEFFFGGAAQ
jgi:hypothetical protein